MVLSYKISFIWLIDCLTDYCRTSFCFHLLGQTAVLSSNRKSEWLLSAVGRSNTYVVGSRTSLLTGLAGSLSVAAEAVLGARCRIKKITSAEPTQWSGIN